LDITQIEGKVRLCPLQSLTLAFLVDAKNYSVGRRVEIEADDVDNLLDEEWIGRELEGLGPVRLQSKGCPDTLDG
jgi:hypothetical protein